MHLSKTTVELIFKELAASQVDNDMPALSA
jgi:hypothetical protein